MHSMTPAPDHALAIDPSRPHQFKAPADDWAVLATGGTNAGTGTLHMRVAQPRAGHPPRCRVLGCARTPDDAIHGAR